MAYLKGRIASEEYNKALMARHPLMNTASNSAAQQAMWTTTTGLGQNTISNSPLTFHGSSSPFEINHRVSQFQVEKVDNGFVLRSGNKAKVCKDMDELRDFFVSIMVEHQLDK